MQRQVGRTGGRPLRSRAASLHVCLHCVSLALVDGLEIMMNRVETNDNEIQQMNGLVIGRYSCIICQSIMFPVSSTGIALAAHARIAVLAMVLRTDLQCAR
jgi:hypothetical protein